MKTVERPDGLPLADRDRLAEVCRRYQVRRLMVFGSRLTGTAGEGSDLDLLVEFEPHATPGLGFMRLADELSRLFGHPVDLHTPSSLSRYFRDEVLAQAKVLYEAVPA